MTQSASAGQTKSSMMNMPTVESSGGGALLSVHARGLDMTGSGRVRVKTVGINNESMSARPVTHKYDTSGWNGVG
jgi:hypothetical protein